MALRVDGENWPTLPAAAPAFAEAWHDLHRDGFKLRSRALTTTLYTRLLVADSFLHGIGGGKYDELTDELLGRFYGVEPPRFLVLSATLLLPLEGYAATPEQHRRLARQLRDLQWNPQRHLPPPPATAATALAADKNRLIADLDGTAPVGRQRHQALRRLTADLQPFVAGVRQRLREELAASDAALHANAILRRRDYAFCLYPESLVRPFCQQFLRPD